MNFDEAFDKLIGHEGGYVNNPKDPGGETKFGVSKKAYPNVDVKNLTVDQAKAIYLKDYWNRLSLQSLPTTIRFDMFDTAVNAGVKTAVILLQRALKVAEDGALGPVTLANASKLDPQLLDKRFNGYRLKYLTDLTVWPTFGKGWARRIAANLIED